MGVLPSIRMPRPPRSVRIIGDCEFAFGACMALPSSIVLFFWPIAALGWELTFVLVILVVLGFAWSSMAIQFLKGRLWAMQTLQILSLVRVVSVLGIPFSLLTLYVLFRNKTVKSYFQKGGN